MNYEDRDETNPNLRLNLASVLVLVLHGLGLCRVARITQFL